MTNGRKWYGTSPLCQCVVEAQRIDGMKRVDGIFAGKRLIQFMNDGMHERQLVQCFRALRHKLWTTLDALQLVDHGFFAEQPCLDDLMKAVVVEVEQTWRQLSQLIRVVAADVGQFLVRCVVVCAMRGLKRQ